MSLKDGTIIEKSRPPAANEFIFFKRVVIDEQEIWDLFEYINSVSNIYIKEIIIKFYYKNIIFNTKINFYS